MKDSSHDQPDQIIEISNSVLENVQIAQAGRDLHLTQIQGGVVSLTVLGSVQVDKTSSHTAQTLSRQEYKWRRVLLSKVQQFWIRGVLKKSLYSEVLIELGLANRDEYVWDPVSGSKEFPVDSLPFPSVETSLEEMFEDIGDGRTLLILGEPGAGKTVTLLKLTESLIDRVKNDLSQPLPVVVNLSSWAKERRRIDEWLVQELYTIYQVSKSLGSSWIENEQLILLLDGLDEVKERYRNACVVALNQFIQDYGRTELVVCSRTQDYKASSEKLKLRSAICVQPPTWEQIDQYLNLAGESLCSLRAILKQSDTLREFASSPLILNIMSIAYQDAPLEMLELAGTLEEQKRQLFDTYIERMLLRHSTTQKYSKSQVISWIVWLSYEMTKNSQTVFFIENLQPSQLSFRFATVFFRFINAVATGLLYGGAYILVGGMFDILIVLLIYGLMQIMIGESAFLKIDSLFEGPLIGDLGWYSALVISILIGLFWGILEAFIYGILARKPSRIRVGDQIKWSWSEARKSFSSNFSNTFVIVSGGVNCFFWFSVLVTVIAGKTDEILGETLSHFSDFPHMLWWSEALFISIFISILFMSIWFLLSINFMLVKLLLKNSKNRNYSPQEIKEFNSSRRKFRSFHLTRKRSKLVVLICFSLLLGFVKIVGGDWYIAWALLISSFIFFVLLFSSILGTVFGLTVGLVYALFSGLRSPSINRKYSYPNQGILESAKNALIFGSGTGLLAGMIVGGLFRLGSGAITLILFTSILAGLIGSLFGGGTSCIKHFVLRLILVFQDKMPWNYTRFLNDAVDRIFLRKVGSGYIFVHRMLLEHFATMEPKE